jgi:hypothetical protein
MLNLAGGNNRIFGWFGHIIHRRRTTVAVTFVVLLAITFQALSFTELGVATEMGPDQLPAGIVDPSTIPSAVIADANRLAASLYEKNAAKRDAFVQQLLAMYFEAQGKDLAVLFNPGGWGWSMVDNSPDWQSILTGIKVEMVDSGYQPILWNYQRSVDTLRGQVKELLEMFTGYSAKASDLASRVEFLTGNIPRLKVILAGESSGSVICDQVMAMLPDNQRVFSIQTGPPFWHSSSKLDRQLILTDNGIMPDSFSQGDFITMARANLRTWFGLVGPEGSGTILLHVQAPGHRYGWSYPEVRSRIEDFLNTSLEAP